MSPSISKEAIRFLFTLRGEFIDAASRIGVSPYTLVEPLHNLVCAETIGHALDLISHGLEQEAITPLKKIEAIFNQEAQAERKEEEKLLEKIFHMSQFHAEQAKSFEQKAQRLREIQTSLRPF